jgi:hypothetical protein
VFVAESPQLSPPAPVDAAAEDLEEAQTTALEEEPTTAGAAKQATGAARLSRIAS